MTDSQPDEGGPVLLPLALFVGAFTLYLITHQRWLFGDGVFFDEILRANNQWIYYQLMYLPLARGLHSVLGGAFGVPPEMTLKALSALCGATGVVVTYSLARRALRSTLGGVVAACTLMALIGYWFHSTAAELHALHAVCSLILFGGLLLLLDQSTQPKSTVFWLFAGACLTPLSHTSGLAMGLPVLYALFKAPSERRVSATFALGLGFLLFVSLYMWAMLASEASRGSASMIADRYAKMLQNPSTILPLATGAAGELLLYSLPVSTLIPAGLRVLFRTAPHYAWLCLLWILAWPIAVFSVGDYAIGSYQMPTFPVQALLAVVALHSLAKTPLRAVAAVAVACAPMIGLYLQSPRIGLLICAVNGIALALVHNDHVERPRLTLLLPLATLAMSAPWLLPKLYMDPYRPRIAAIAAIVPRDDLVLLLTDDVGELNHWRRFFPGGAPRERVYPLWRARLDNLPAELAKKADEIVAFADVEIPQAMGAGRGVWVVGDPNGFPDRPRVAELFEKIRASYRLDRPPGEAPPQLFKLLRR